MSAGGPAAGPEDGPLRIVVLRALGLGDLLTGVPALRALRDRYPGAVITLAAPGALAPIAALADLPEDPAAGPHGDAAGVGGDLAGAHGDAARAGSGAAGAHGDVAGAHGDVAGAHGGAAGAHEDAAGADGDGRLVRVVDEVADTAPLAPLAPRLRYADLAVNLHGRGPESTRLLVDSAPRRLITFASAGLPMTRRSPRWRADEHEVDRWCRLLTESGIPANPSRLELRRPEAPSPAPGAVIVHPGAGAPARCWPPGRWVAVARALRADGHDIVVTGSADEVPLAERVAGEAGLPPGSVLAGRTGLAALAALTASASLVLSGDTGIAHLAAAYRRPAVTLAGPVPPRLWGPPPRPWHAVLWSRRHGHTDRRGHAHEGGNAGPDGNAGDPHGTRPDPRLLEITVDAALAAVRDVLAASAERSR